MSLQDGAVSQPGGISARGLIHVYPGPAGGVAALRGLELDIESGEIAAIVGPSGSGKSTLLRLLAGIERPSAGSLLVNGRPLELATDRELERYRLFDVAMVEQHYRSSLSPYLPVAEAVELPMAVRGWALNERRSRVAELLERVGLGDRGGALPAQLSGGEQQRVAVAAALAIRPVILLADEPTGELDAETAVAVFSLIVELSREEGATCVIVTHDDLVEEVAARSIHVRDGRAVADRVHGVIRPHIDSAGWRAPELPELPPPVRVVGAASRGVPAVQVEDIRRRFGRGPAGVDALTGVTASFESGRFHVVTGPSGSGKTTLLRIVAGLEAADGGTVRTLGQDLAEADREASARLRAERVGYVPQAARLIPFLTARENVGLALELRGRSRNDAHGEAIEALIRLEIEALADRRPDTLSAGERARVAIARAVAARPALLLLDEPTAALDRRSARLVAAMLARLAGPEMTVIAATHDRDLIAAAGGARFELRRRPPLEVASAS